MNPIRRHLTYANVVSTICLFLVLGGATAFAAKQLARNSVGAKQLKKNAVTAAKLKNGAVTGAKLGSGSVDGTKLAGGAVSADKLDPALFIPRVTQTIVGTQQVAFPPAGGNAVLYPLDNPAFTQPAGVDLMYVGAITARFGESCKAPRQFTALLREEDPNASGGARVLGKAFGEFETSGGEPTVTAYFGSIDHGPMTALGAGTPTQHTLQVRLERIFCGTGSPPSATATVLGVKIDAVGFR